MIPPVSLYAGTVRHRRLVGTRREFRRPLLMVMLDLDRVGELRREFPILNRAGLMNFRAADCFPQSPDGPKSAALRIVEKESGRKLAGPVHILAQPRQLGVGYNPVRFYLVANGGAPEWLVAEVHNTPWGERAAYAAPLGSDAKMSRATLRKRMHVSPFNPMAMRYRWRFAVSDSRFAVHMECVRDNDGEVGEDNAPDMDATLHVRCVPESRRTVEILRRPFGAGMSLFHIYANAAILLSRGAKFYSHPSNN